MKKRIEIIKERNYLAIIDRDYKSWKRRLVFEATIQKGCTGKMIASSIPIFEPNEAAAHIAIALSQYINNGYRPLNHQLINYPKRK